LARGRRLRRRERPDGVAAARWRDTAAAWFADTDVLCSPVVARRAPATGWAARAGFWAAYLNGARGLPYTQPGNLAGFPAMSLPLPGQLSVQLVCLPGNEAALFSLAGDLESAARASAISPM